MENEYQHMNNEEMNKKKYAFIKMLISPILVEKYPQASKTLTVLMLINNRKNLKSM